MVGGFTAGCAQRSFSYPRSQIIENADSQGTPIPTIVADRESFFRDQESNQTRVVALIKRRSGSDMQDANYRIGPADELEINVFDVPELNVTAKVRQSGFVSLPLIGAVKVVGLNEGEVVDAISHRLAEFVKRPQVSVFVSHYGSQKVAVLGAVRTPGNYSLKKGANSISELISEAGGLSDKAGNQLNFVPSEITGIGADNDIESRARLALGTQSAAVLRGAAIEIPLDQVLGTAGAIPLEVPVRGGDMIILPEAGKLMVEGEVQRIGSVDLTRRMTLLSALASSGGITYGAKVDEVEVIREIDGRKVHLVLDLTKLATGEEKDVLLRNGDIVRVPSDTSRRLTQDTFDGLSRIINFGIGGNYSVAP